MNPLFLQQNFSVKQVIPTVIPIGIFISIIMWLFCALTKSLS